MINADAAKAFGIPNNVPVLQWKYKISLNFPLSAKAILYDKDERPKLFAYFVQGGSVKFWTMHMTMCTLVLQMALHVQCIH